MQVYLHSHKEPRHSRFDLRLEEKNARQRHLSLLFRFCTILAKLVRLILASNFRYSVKSDILAPTQTIGSCNIIV